MMLQVYALHEVLGTSVGLELQLELLEQPENTATLSIKIDMTETMGLILEELLTLE
jgi:hypothetical protein